MFSLKKIWLVLIIVLAVAGLLFGNTQAANYTVSSPDGSIVVTVAHDTGTGTLSYSVTKSGNTVLESSALGINTNVADFTTGLAYVANTPNTINESYSMPGRKKATYVNNANELTLKFSKNSREMHLIVRAYNDGIAYRYYIPGSGSININSESSAYNLPSGAVGWAQTFTNNYEAFYNYKTLSDMSSGDYGMPLLVKYSNNYWSLLSEAAVYGTYCGSHLHGSGAADGVLKVVFAPDQTSAVTGTCPFYTPWRAAIMGASLPPIVESTLIENLNPASELSDTSWVIPGRSAWSWWSGDSTSDYNTQVSYVDFASSMGWEYYLCDEGWQESWVPNLVTYANSKNVKIILWSHHNNLDTDTEISTNLSKWAGWGVKGIKVDFFDSDSQTRIQVYDKIAQAAITYKLLVNYHGATKPAGERRRWPHLMTREGVYGAEYYKWSTGPTAAHNCTLPFTRNAVGPMDYTPVTYSNNKSQTTWAHLTALDVVFESNIQHLADKPSSYNASAAKDFLKACPTTWDDTRLIEGYPASYVTIARKNGTNWFIGAICGGGTSRTATIPLSFLGSGTFTAKIYKDGSSDTSIVYEQQSVTSSTTLSIPLRTNGGCAIQIVPGSAATPTPTPTSTPTPTAAPLPAPWVFNDIGGPGVAGSASYSSGVFTITGGGTDIWNNSDQFAYVHQGVSGDSTISVRVTSQTNTDPWAKAGVMFRETINADSKYVDLIATPSNGLSLQWRSATAGTCSYSTLGSFSFPIYLRLVRSGSTFNAYKSSDGSNWGSSLGSCSVTMTTAVKTGMCVTSHNNSTTSTANFDNVSVSGAAATATPTPTPTPGATATPTPTPASGSDEFTSGTLGAQWSWVREDNTKWSLTANPGYMRIITQNGDLWGTTNTMKNILLQTPATADFSITTKLTISPAQDFQQAGLIVYSDDGNYVSMSRKYGGGKKFGFIKETAGTPTEQNATDSLGTTVYLKITKSGTTYTGYYSSDGTTWTQLGSAYTGVSLTSPKVGLFSANGGSTAPSINADFDYFRY